jgi:hypothetical protein
VTAYYNEIDPYCRTMAPTNVRLCFGRCELTGIQFDFNGRRGGWANPSIDRKDAACGYVYANIRIILHGLNTAIGHWGEDILLRMIAAWQERR